MDHGHLIDMANQIGAFFESMPDRDEALTGIAEHIRRFWEPRMRRALRRARRSVERSRTTRDADLARRDRRASGVARAGRGPGLKARYAGSGMPANQLSQWRSSAFASVAVRPRAAM